jgi:predicted negative regulator of RcsB-dependent stress response
VYVALNKREEAEKDYRKAIEINQQNENAFLSLQVQLKKKR